MPESPSGDSRREPRARRSSNVRSDPDRVDALFASYAARRRRATRNELVELHMGLARHIARRFGRGRTDNDDLEQVALIGLVKAVDRFDPERGVSLATYAGRTIEGELKRHFRDATWQVRVPRSIKDLHVSVRSTSEELTQELGRAPTVKELAARLDVGTDDVLEALGAVSARAATSLDVPAGGSPTDHMAVLSDEGGFAGVDDRGQVAQLMDHLDPREQEIVRLRFEEGLSQDRIAQRIGISQMHVSRLLRRSLETMRAATRPDAPGSGLGSDHEG